MGLTGFDWVVWSRLEGRRGGVHLFARREEEGRSDVGVVAAQRQNALHQVQAEADARVVARRDRRPVAAEEALQRLRAVGAPPETLVESAHVQHQLINSLGAKPAAVGW